MLSERSLDGWAAALATVLAVGVAPIADVEVLRELWRRGGADRALAEQVRARLVVSA